MSLHIQKNSSVSLRNGFSDRYTLKEENKILQLKEFNRNTRIILLNHLNKISSIRFKRKNSDEQFFIKNALSDLYKEKIDFNEFYSRDLLWDKINQTFDFGKYYDILTIIEYFYNKLFSPSLKSEYEKCDDLINQVFEEEYIGYRMIKGLITPITNPQEIKTIKKVILSPFEGISKHIEKAICLLKEKDYENTIKESISAVESMCCVIVREDTSLGKALSLLEKKGVHIHPSLKEAFHKLYGFTSDEKGIRHGGSMDSPNTTFDEAKFMLVTCSAFVNYLIGVSKL